MLEVYHGCRLKMTGHRLLLDDPSTHGANVKAAFMYYRAMELTKMNLLHGPTSYAANPLQFQGI